MSSFGLCVDASGKVCLTHLKYLKQFGVILFCLLFPQSLRASQLLSRLRRYARALVDHDRSLS